MGKYNKIAKYLFGGKMLQEDNLEKIKKSFGMNSFFSLDEFEKKVNAAALAKRRIVILNDKFNKELNFYGSRLKLYQVFYQREAYIYLFFCAVSRVYKELILLKSYSDGKYDAEIDVFIHKLKPLSDQRDGLEHGVTEDTHALNMNKITSHQSEDSLKRKAFKGDNFDFDKNMKIIDEAYKLIINKLSL